MGKAYKDLAYLLDKCTTDKEYLLKNKENYIKNAEITDLSKVFEWKNKIDQYTFSEKYNERIELLDRTIIEKNDKLEFRVDFEKYSIEELTDQIKFFEGTIEMINSGIQSVDSNLYLLRDKEYNKLLNELYFIKKQEIDSYNKLLISTIKEYYFRTYAYDEEILKKILEDTDINELINNTVGLIYLYNKLLTSKYKRKGLVNCLEVYYERARELSEMADEVIYLTDLEKDMMLTNYEVLTIDYSNYKENINVRCKADLTKDAAFNIRLLLGETLKNTNYIISAKAYFAALQDLKLNRGKRYCWICRERLGFFSSGVTCKEHNEYEDII